MYCLQAAIAREPVLRALAGPLKEAHTVALGQHLSLLPMTDELVEAITVAESAALNGFWKAPASFDSMLVSCSTVGPVAYVEAEFFGGVGTQSAQVWDGGAVTLGPLQLAEGEPPSAAGSPISQALRQLGVAKKDYFDEFDAVGLGRHRETQDWLAR